MTLETESTAEDKARAFGRGWRVAIALAALTAVEYLIAVSVEDPLLFLLPFVFAKAWLILDYFMHVRDLREGD